MPSTDRTAKLARYAAAHTLLTEALARFPREMWHFKPSETDWSIHEIVVHITDSEANSYIRARRLIAEPGRTLMDYDENAWATALDYHGLDTEDAVELFRWLRGTTYKLIKDLPEETWTHAAHHPENGDMTLDDWLSTYARHVSDHIGQMEVVHSIWQNK
ncbi:MAG TPA: DinB family protein [Anaerolineales bacterium]|nr:DinB family protein [Anaerolineales bacterium]